MKNKGGLLWHEVQEVLVVEVLEEEVSLEVEVLEDSEVLVVDQEVFQVGLKVVVQDIEVDIDIVHVHIEEIISSIH